MRRLDQIYASRGASRFDIFFMDLPENASALHYDALDAKIVRPPVRKVPRLSLRAYMPDTWVAIHNLSELGHAGHDW